MSDMSFWDEEESASNLTQAFYVAGTGRLTKQPHVIKLSQTLTGWMQRRVAGDDCALDVDYVSNETRSQLKEWFMCDFLSRFYISADLSDVLAKHHDAQSVKKSRQADETRMHTL